MPFACWKKPRDEERQAPAKQARCFEVYERRTIKVVANDKLLLMANRRELGFARAMANW